MVAQTSDEKITIHQHIAELEEVITTANYSTNLQSKLQINLRSIEESFLETQHKLSFLVERNPLAVITWNKAFEVMTWNPAAESIFGYSKHEAIGRDAGELLVPKTAREHVHQMMTALIEQEGGIHSTNKNITKGGKTITCKWYNTPLTDVNGNSIGIVSMVEDITESRTMEAALSRSEARFRKLVTNVPGMIYQFRLEPDGTTSFPYVSDACREIFGIEPEEVQQNGALLTEAVYAEDQKSFLDSVAVSAQTLQHWDWEGRMIARSREIKWIRGISRPELQADGAIIWDGLLVDVSEQQAALNELQQTKLALEQAKAELEIRVEERTAYLQQEIYERQQTFKELQRTQSQLIQSEKMSSLGQLVAGVAHEINNPVNFIYGNLSHAQQYTEDLLNLLNLYQSYYPEPGSEIQDKAEAIDIDFVLEDLPKLHTSMKVGATRIREIVASLRTFSRLDEAEYKEADIHEGIDSTLMILEHRLKAKPDRTGITVIKEYGEILLVACYAGQLNQVFMNILANAIDAVEDSFVNRNFSFNRQPLIRIRTEISASNQIRIRIADNGVGMCESVLKRLFDPFYTTKPVGKGTGMGLSISYQIVTERHGGTLECISKPGEGSEFVITLPRMEIRD